MKRRKFFKNTMILAGGVALMSSASNAKENTNLIQSDPEFSEFFHYFSEVEVSKYNKLDEQTTLLARLASIIANGSLGLFKEELNKGLRQNASVIAIKEMIYQCVPYFGLAKVYDFLELCNEIFKENGIKLPLEKQGTTTKENRYEKGLELQVHMFGERILKDNESAPKDMKHFREFLSANCFGDYYTREGLDLKTRELLTFVYLASLGGCENQLKGHTQGNFNMKNDRSVLISILTQICPFIGYPKTLNALKIIEEVSKNKI